jgi:predicted component of type VI protein secretion system
MPLKLTITKNSDPSFLKQLSFSIYPVVIGREEKNEVVLQDPRKIVSRNHAKILDKEGILKIIDLGSANFTYLNGERIFPNNDYTLNTGDIIKIGDYEIEVFLVQSKIINALDDQKTMPFSSPFADEVKKLFDDFNKLSEKYAVDSSTLKSEMLRFSIMQSLDSLEINEVNQIISEYFVYKFLEHGPTDQEEKKFSIQPTINIPEAQENKQASQPLKTSDDSFLKSNIDYSFSTHFSESVDIMLDTIVKLIQGFLHFRQEFFGVTIYQTIPTGSLKEIKEYLFNQEISPEEQRKRINLIKEETQKLLSHQIGLLEGYRISVTEGSQSLLQSLDPAIIEKEIASKQTSGLDNLLPYSKKIKTLEAIKQSYKKYISDPYHLEKKFFRPAFIKGYQKRISSKNEMNEY